MKHQLTMITTAAALLMPAAAANADYDYGGEVAIRVLADDVTYFAGEVHREARYLARGRSDHRALGALRALDRDARHFSYQIGRYYRDPLHTARDFERLRVSFYVAHDALPRFYGYGNLERDFYALADAMRRLEYAFRDVGYRYRRPLPRLHFSINLGAPFHHPRGHRVYRKRHGHGFRWFSSIDLRHYDKPRHHKRHYDRRDDDRHRRKHYRSDRGRRDHDWRDRDRRRGRDQRWERRDRDDRRDRDHRRRGRDLRSERRDRDRDEDRDRRGRGRGSARDSRPRR